ncbi:MAG: hypothetical protein P8013_03315 [Candidatus Sulfobium sp.]|jgi:hypothetical protein
MKNRLDRQGSIKFFFTLAILVVGAFVLISFGKPYYRYYTLRSYAHDELLMEVGNVNTIRRKVLQRADELGIPLDADNLEVKKNRVSKVVTVKANWSEVVDFWGYYTRKLDFTLTEEY